MLATSQTSCNASDHPLKASVERLESASHHDPFAVLGMHEEHGLWVYRCFRPACRSVELVVGKNRHMMQRVLESDVFECAIDVALEMSAYTYRVVPEQGDTYEMHDPYRAAPLVSENDIYLFNHGEHVYAYRFLGAHHCQHQGLEGVLFVVWAPSAERVSILGNFNGWDGRIHPMRSRGSSGIWEIFLPNLESSQPYKFEIRNRDTGAIFVKMDPYARQTEFRPATASVIPVREDFSWQDQDWLKQRAQSDWLHAPLSIYELHLGSWQKDEQGQFLNYREIARRLVPYVHKLGYTHVQLMPVSEHPFDGSWGYQVTGYFSPTARFGQPEDFAWFVDYLHQHGIGVFLDWVPAHFPKDEHALARFDGSALYEHEDPLLGEHKDWGTLIFNYGRSEVQSFLLSSALYFLEEFHIDGLRVDAVASMLYLDYSREDGEWRPNKYGGNENLEAVDFIRKLNEVTHARYPGVVVMAEESTSWPGVSKPTYLGGLGFSMKWNMGWMNDSLEYMSLDSVYRKYHHDKLTFALLYAFSENFILPLSHDEVVHMKKSLIGKMPGDQWQQFANLRLLYLYMFTQPGKKLLFMGGDLAQYDEWNHAESIQWHLLDYPLHQGIQNLVSDLNRLYREQVALHRYDFEAQGFEWVDCHDSSQSVLSYRRKSGDEDVLVLLNFTPVPRENYRIGVHQGGRYQELFNTDADHYGGGNVGNGGFVESDAVAWGGCDCSLSLSLPPLGGIVLKRA